MVVDDSMFANVPLNTDRRNPCSPPAPGSGWRGIVIQAPKRVTFKRGEPVGGGGAFAVIPICGLYVLDVAAVPPDAYLKLVALEARTKQMFTGALGESDPSPNAPPPPAPPVDPALLVGLGVQEYFNPNLAEYVHLPEKSAVYEVHAEYGPFKSNTVTIELIEERK